MAEESSIGMLISKEMHGILGARLRALARSAGQTLDFVISPDRPGQPLSAAQQDSVRLAFYSRDLLMGSTKTEPSPASLAFFDAVDAAPRAQWLHVCTAGVDMPQYRTTLQRPVRLTTSSGSNAVPIAQTAVGAILAQSRGFTYWLDAQSASRWEPMAAANIAPDLHEQTAVIVGLGPIGREIGRLLKAVGLTTIGVRRSCEPVAHFDRVVRLDAVDTLLPACDWLVLACPLTPETQGLASAARLALLPDRAGVVNVGRGELLDELALAQALDGHRLRSAYLDVFSVEPLPSASPLWRTRNTWISPHNAAASPGNAARVAEIFLRNFERWLAGSPLENEAMSQERPALAETGLVEEQR